MDSSIDYTWENDHGHTPKIEQGLSKILNKQNYKSLNHIDVGCGNGALTIKFYKYLNDNLNSEKLLN